MWAYFFLGIIHIRGQGRNPSNFFVCFWGNLNPRQIGSEIIWSLVWMWIGMKIRWTIHALILQPLSFLMRLWNLYYIVIMYQKTFYQVRTKKLLINDFSFLEFKNSILFQNTIVWTRRLIIKSFYLPMATTVLYGQNTGNTGQLLLFYSRISDQNSNKKSVTKCFF